MSLTGAINRIKTKKGLVMLYDGETLIIEFNKKEIWLSSYTKMGFAGILTTERFIKYYIKNGTLFLHYINDLDEEVNLQVYPIKNTVKLNKLKNLGYEGDEYGINS